MHNFSKLVALLLVSSAASAGWVTLNWTPTPGVTGVKSGCVATNQYERALVPINGAAAGTVTIQGLPDSGRCYFELNAGPQDEWFFDFTTLVGGIAVPGPIANLAVTWAPSPPMVGRRFLRFTFTSRRGGENSMQLNEIELLLNGVRVPWPQGPTVTNPGGSNPTVETPLNLVTQTNLKWLDFNFSTSLTSLTGRSVVVIDAKVPITFNGYRFRTANDVQERDPVTWTLEASADGVTYAVIDMRTNALVPTARDTLTGTFSTL